MSGNRCFPYNLLVGSNVLLATESRPSHPPLHALCSLRECGKAHLGSASHLGKTCCNPGLVLSPSRNTQPLTRDWSHPWTAPPWAFVLSTPLKQECTSQPLIQRKLHLVAQALSELRSARFILPCADYKCVVYPRPSAINKCLSSTLFLFKYFN